VRGLHGMWAGDAGVLPVITPRSPPVLAACVVLGY
jgi:hypothetical protein